MTAKLLKGAATAAILPALFVHAPAASAQQRMQATAPAQVQQVMGEIVGIRRVPIKSANARNVLVLLETPRGNKIVVDLGDRLRNVNLRPGYTLRARGEVVNVGNRKPLLMASSFYYNGHPYDTNRVAFFQRGTQVGGMQQQGSYGSGQR